MCRLRVWAAVAAAIAVVWACPAVAGEKPEQVVYQGKPITLGAAVEATELFTIRDVKFRLGKFTVDGKPALVASGFLDWHLEIQAHAGVQIFAYGLREDVRGRRLVCLGSLTGGLDVTEPGKPAKFYAAGEMAPALPGVKEPKRLSTVYYAAVPSAESLREPRRGSTTYPGEKTGQFIHENRPIALGTSVEPKEKELIVARGLAFRTGQFLDGKPAIVAWGQLEAQAPVSEGVALGLGLYVTQEKGDADRSFMEYAGGGGRVQNVGPGKPAKFLLVLLPRLYARDVPVPKKAYFLVSCRHWF